MLKQIPPEKISLGKKVLRIENKDNKVIIHCSDNTFHEGDILVGADGAYSSVRQSLYRDLDSQGLLPKSDLEQMSIGFVGMVGATSPKNPEKYPQMKDNNSHYSQVLGPDSRSVGYRHFYIPNVQGYRNVQTSHLIPRRNSCLFFSGAFLVFLAIRSVSYLANSFQSLKPRTKPSGIQSGDQSQTNQCSKSTMISSAPGEARWGMSLATHQRISSQKCSWKRSYSRLGTVDVQFLLEMVTYSVS